MTATRPLIGPGVRAPDFALPHLDEDGPVRFYGRVGGRPVVLVFAGDATDRGRSLATRLAAELDGRADVVVLALAAGAGSAAGAPTVEAFRDLDGRVHAAYGVEPHAPHAVVLDPNLRVIAAQPLTADVGDGDQDQDQDRDGGKDRDRDANGATVAAIAAHVPSPPADDDRPAPRLAPVLYVPEAITAPLRDRLLTLWETGGSVETGVETVVDGARAEATDVRRKRRRDHVVTDPPLLRELTQHLGARVFPELQKAFAFAAGGFEGFKIACYADASRGHFEAHRDNLSALTAHRRFGFSLNLNDDYTGGELRFPEYGTTRHRPAAREALLFSGSHLHEVLPVTSGRRFVLLSFVLAKGGTVAR